MNPNWSRSSTSGKVCQVRDKLRIVQCLRVPGTQLWRQSLSVALDEEFWAPLYSQWINSTKTLAEKQNSLILNIKPKIDNYVSFSGITQFTAATHTVSGMDVTIWNTLTLVKIFIKCSSNSSSETWDMTNDITLLGTVQQHGNVVVNTATLSSHNWVIIRRNSPHIMQQFYEWQ